MRERSDKCRRADCGHRRDEHTEQAPDGAWEAGCAVNGCACAVFLAPPTKREEAECHVCGWKWRKPFAAGTGEVVYAGCACTDRGPCVYHRVSDEPMPDRPPEAVMVERAAALTRGRLEGWEAKRNALRWDENQRKREREAVLAALWEIGAYRASSPEEEVYRDACVERVKQALEAVMKKCPACRGRCLTNAGGYGRSTALCAQCKGLGVVLETNKEERDEA